VDRCSCRTVSSCQQHRFFLPFPVLRERAGVRVSFSRPQEKTLTLTLPEYRERE
jgi:hypothetical protein